VADLVGCLSGFVLLAAGGAGKTFVMNRLREREPSALAADLRARSGPELRAVVRDALASAVAARPGPSAAQRNGFSGAQRRVVQAAEERGQFRPSAGGPLNWAPLMCKSRR
jgi:hypothetical protein